MVVKSSNILFYFCQGRFDLIFNHLAMFLFTLAKCFFRTLPVRNVPGCGTCQYPIGRRDGISSQPFVGAFSAQVTVLFRAWGGHKKSSFTTAGNRWYRSTE